MVESYAPSLDGTVKTTEPSNQRLSSGRIESLGMGRRLAPMSPQSFGDKPGRMAPGTEHNNVAHSGPNSG